MGVSAQTFIIVLQPQIFLTIFINSSFNVLSYEYMYTTEHILQALKKKKSKSKSDPKSDFLFLFFLIMIKLKARLANHSGPLFRIQLPEFLVT